MTSNKENIDISAVKNMIEKVTEEITSMTPASPLTDHINKYPLPSREVIISVLKDLFDILFPGYYADKEITDLNIKNFVGNKINCVYEKLSDEIKKSFMQDHLHDSSICEICDESEKKSIDATMALIGNIGVLRDLVSKDVMAAYDGDPAAKNYAEVIFSYPCILAITVHRIAHFLYIQNVPFIPRIMSEYAHGLTGIDIHPGATIGEYFFIDHGTGVVIGETCTIGNHVKLYQGVTLGALSFPKDDEGNPVKGLKRHPDIENNVTIYAGATILGGKTVIGSNSVIGGNVWIVESVPPDTRVSMDLSQATTMVSKKKLP